MREIEFYLLRLYVRPGGFHLALMECQNFSNGSDLSLLSLDWQSGSTVKLAVWSANAAGGTPGGN